MLEFVEQIARVADGAAVDAVPGQRALDQRDGDARVLDDEHAVFSGL